MSEVSDTFTPDPQILQDLHDNNRRGLSEEDFPQVQELLREQLPEIAYSTNETEFYDDCPETLAEEYLDYEGCGPVIVYSGTPYIPTLQDEKDYLIGEGMQYCIKDVKPCYVYDKGELKDYSGE